MNILRRRLHTALSYSLTARPAGRQSRARLTLAIEGLLLFVGLWAALILRISVNYGQLEEGRPSPYSIQAPRSTTYVSEVLTDEARSQAESRPENLIYRTDLQIAAEQRRGLQGLIATVGSLRDDPTLSRAEKVDRLAGSASATIDFDPVDAEAILSLDGQGWSELSGQALALYDRALAQNNYSLDEKALGVLSETSLPYWAQVSGLSPLQQGPAIDMVRAFLHVNRTLDEEATARRRAEAVAAVQPVEVEVQAGENIVRVGEIVTPEKLEKLQQTGAVPRPLGWLFIGGRGLVAALCAAGFMAYLVFFQAPVVAQPRSAVAVIGLIVTAVIAAALLLPVAQDRLYALPLAGMALIVAVVFNGRLALAAVTVAGTVIAMATDNSLGLAMTLVASSAAAIFIVRDADRLLSFLLAGAAIAATVVVTQLAFWLTSRPSLALEDIARDLPVFLVFGGLNGALSAVMALGTFNLVGRAAGVVTPFQLMELAHPSRPLLRRLIREAPGTYYHSVAVGNLAEAAAEAVGADALLLRVAAYYHDIGKTIRPYFFTDNQMGRENVHNELDPATSAQIIVDHVREGVKMARAAGLPEPIVDFIATHHGTGLIRHFYQLALQQHDAVNIADFRYPGPRPRTREEGILMLADSVEATVRSKAQNGKLLASRAEGSNGGAQTLEELVGSIIDARVREGELDEAPLTIRDLAVIKQTFITNLQSIYHPRVDYAPPVVR